MSASVSNYLFVMEERQRAHRSTMRNTIAESGVGVPANSPVKRCLFGEPDRMELKRKYDELHEEERKRGAKKWGFDFETETPIENSRYEWERVGSSASVPKAYDLPHLGTSQSSVHQRQSTSSNDVEEELAPSPPLPSEPSSCENSSTSSSSSRQQTLITEHFKMQKRPRQHPGKHSESSSSAEKRQCVPPALVSTPSSNEGSP